VFESRLAGGPHLRTQVPIVPATFAPGKPYTISLDALVLNNPIPGASYSDSASYTFAVAGSQTTLGLKGTYDDLTKNLYAFANLTDVDGYPVINEPVRFSLQLKGDDPLTDGWIPLGSSVTDMNGTARLSVGLNIPFVDQMAVKADHEGNLGFGPSEKTSDANVISNFSQSLMYMSSISSNATHTSEIGVSDVGTVSIHINENTTYALLGKTITANYTSSTPLTGSWSWMFFWVDNNGSSAWQGGPQLTLVSNGSSYVYQATFIWGPTVVGAHTLIAGVVSGDGRAYNNALNGTGVIAWGNITLNINPCPTNLVLHLPEAVYNSNMSVSVGFAQPWPYAANNDGEFTASSLAPQITYDGVSYAFDEPVNASVLVSLYVNGTYNGTATTDGNGTADFQYSLSFSGAYSNLNVTCATNCSTLLFNDSTATTIVNLTNVNVKDDPTGQGRLFALSCTVDGQATTAGLETGTIYVETQNDVETSARLNDSGDSGVSAAPTSVLIGRPLKRTYVDASGCVSVPNGSNMLRAASFYNISTTGAGAALADINHDGTVDGKDITIVAGAFGSIPGATNWNWRADVNLDVKVDGKDLTIVAGCFGESVTYLTIPNCSLVNASFFVNGNLSNSSLDSSGCVSIPNGAVNVTFSIGGSPLGTVVEFFENASHTAQAGCTDDSGVTETSWTPQIVAPFSSTYPPYLILAWLPLSFQVATTQSIGSTSVKDSLISATYLNVTTRPVSLVLTNSSYESYTLVEQPIVDLYFWGGSGGYDEFTNNLTLGYLQTNGGLVNQMIYLQFNISDIPANQKILSAKIKAYCKDASTLSSSRQYYINSVNQSWTPGAGSPILNSPTDNLSWSPNKLGWMVWDVTTDVQSWYANPALNYGHVIQDPGTPPNSQCCCTLASTRINGQVMWPVLEVTCVPIAYLPVGLEASVVDGANGEPLSNATVTFSGGCSPASNVTDSSGVAWTQLVGPSTAAAPVVTASYAGDSFHDSASDSLCLDFRTTTSLNVSDPVDGCLTNGQVISMGTLETREFSCSVSPPIAASEGVQVYVNGTWYTNTTLGLDTTSFSWNATAAGVYFMNITYGGDNGYQLSQFLLEPEVQVSPVCLSFNATPSEFAPGASVTLYAQAVNPLDGASLQGVHVQFLENGNSSIGPVLSTGPDGVVTQDWTYPSNVSVCTVSTSVIPDTSVGNCTLAVQPLTLTVGNETQLLLQAWRDPQGTGHTIYAQLVNGSGYYLGAGYTVTLTVNGTAYPLQTNSTGCVTLHLALQPGDTSANTYEVMATFNGTNPRSFSINASDPYGDQYAVCTTNQYDLRASTNSSTLEVLLQSTDAITAAQTIKQMQEQAEQNGTFSVYNEWSWWYPWYRIHYQFRPNGTVEYDDGLSPLPFGNTLQYTALMSQTVIDLWQKCSIATASAIAAAELQGLIVSELGVPGFLCALVTSWGVELASLAANWNSIEGLESAFVGSVISTIVGIAKDIALNGLEILSVLEGIVDLTEVGFGTLYNMISTPSNVAFQIAILGRLAQLGVSIF
jgi:hypothetical protein